MGPAITCRSQRVVLAQAYPAARQHRGGEARECASLARIKKSTKVLSNTFVALAKRLRRANPEDRRTPQLSADQRQASGGRVSQRTWSTVQSKSIRAMVER